MHSRFIRQKAAAIVDILSDGDRQLDDSLSPRLGTEAMDAMVMFVTWHDGKSLKEERQIKEVGFV